MSSDNSPPAGPVAVELFAGAGGMALGLSQAGFSHPTLVEWDKRGVAVLRANAGSSSHLWDDTAVLHEDVRRWLENLPEERILDLDLLAGGPPCQPFSAGGVHAGHADDRNMFPAAVEALRELRPKLALFENVPGLLRPSFLPYYEYVLDQVRYPGVRPNPGEAWAAHHARIKEWAVSNPLEYFASYQVVNAADLGVPQIRKRVFLTAIRQDQKGANTWLGAVMTHSLDALLVDKWVTGEYWKRHGLPRPPVPTELASEVEKLKQYPPTTAPWRTVRDALQGLPYPVDGTDHPTLQGHRGIPGARVYKGHTGSPIDLPAKALKAGVHGVPGGEAMIVYPDGSLRYMTVREAARIQGFPDDYEFPGSRSSAMWTIGNAVAVPVAKQIGEQLAAHVGLSLKK